MVLNVAGKNLKHDIDLRLIDGLDHKALVMCHEEKAATFA